MSGSPATFTVNPALPVGISIASSAAKDKRLAATNKIVIPFLLFLGSFYVLFNIPNYFWYYAPFLYFSYLYAANLIPRTKTAWCVALVLIAALTNVSAVTLRLLGVENTNYANLAGWLNHNTPQNAKNATTETGTIGWYCDRKFIDMVGLTTPQMQRSQPTATSHRGLRKTPTTWSFIRTFPFPGKRWRLPAPTTSSFRFISAPSTCCIGNNAD